MSLVLDTVKKVAVNATMGILITRLPFLGIPGIKQIVQYFITRLVDIIVDQTELGLYVVYARNITEAQAEKFKEAVKKSEKAQTEGEKKIAQDELIEASRNLIRFTL